MAAIRLGKNHLRWCDECNLPILEVNTCPVCGKPTHEVEVTPPGEVRPAFDHDIDMIRGLVDVQFGEGIGKVLIPEGRIVLLNKAPSLDRMDEVIIDGCTVATMRYDLAKGWLFLNRMQSAMRISKSMIVNLRKIQNVCAEPGGRMVAVLLNGERVIISRSYVKEIKRRLGIQ